MGRRDFDLHRRDVPGGRGAGPADWPGADGHGARLCQAPQLSGVPPQQPERRLHRAGYLDSRADHALPHRWRYFAGLVHGHGVRRHRSDLRGLFVHLLLPRDDLEEAAHSHCGYRPAGFRRAVLRGHRIGFWLASGVLPNSQGFACQRHLLGFGASGRGLSDCRRIFGGGLFFGCDSGDHHRWHHFAASGRFGRSAPGVICHHWHRGAGVWLGHTALWPVFDDLLFGGGRAHQIRA